jgi:phosphoribosylanthranilate isomerase
MVNPLISFLKKISNFVDGFQLHGDETPDFCKLVKNEFPNHLIWKALQVRKIEDIKKVQQYDMISTFLFDAFSKKAYGGTGENISLEILPYLSKYLLKNQIFFLAGGINLKNIIEYKNLSKPSGIDLSSSLEVYKGKKSELKINKFFQVFS